MELREESKKKEVYYKLVRCENDKFYSFALVEEEHRVEYKIDKWVTAPEENKKKNYHLLVFESIKSVEKFSKTNPISISDRLFKCQIKNRIKNMPPRRIINFMGKMNITTNEKWPDGTIGVEYVKIYGKNLMNDY